tara:strand:+ start:3863 stop:4345 length:483 start_codon:yes stop_codon:yes gene_type:complete
MKNIAIITGLFLLILAILFTLETADPPQATIVEIEVPPADSILNLADQVVEYVIGREVRKEQHIDSLRGAMKISEDLSAEQIIKMEKEMRKTKKQQHLYSEELDAYKSKRVVKRDSIVYSIKKVKKVDTVIITVYDTVVVLVNKKLCKQHIKNQKKKKND